MDHCRKCCSFLAHLTFSVCALQQKKNTTPESMGHVANTLFLMRKESNDPAVNDADHYLSKNSQQSGNGDGRAVRS